MKPLNLSQVKTKTIPDNVTVDYFQVTNSLFQKEFPNWEKLEDAVYFKALLKFSTTLLMQSFIAQSQQK
jgi:hypothetical protein